MILFPELIESGLTYRQRTLMKEKRWDLIGPFVKYFLGMFYFAMQTIRLPLAHAIARNRKLAQENKTLKNELKHLKEANSKLRKTVHDLEVVEESNSLDKYELLLRPISGTLSAIDVGSTASSISSSQRQSKSENSLKSRASKREEEKLTRLLWAMGPREA